MKYLRENSHSRHSGMILSGIQSYAITDSVERFGSDSSGFQLRACPVVILNGDCRSGRRLRNDEDMCHLAIKKILLAFLAFLLCTTSDVHAGISIIGGLSREKVAQPGETYQGTIILGNNGTVLEEVKVFQSDYLFFADGSNRYDKPGTVPRSNGGWITLSPTRLTIAPQEQVLVDYTVKVPADPNLTGTYWSMVVIEPIPDAHSDGGAEKGKIKVGITQVIRYGIQVMTHIGDTGSYKVKILDKSFIQKEGKSILQIDIENIGERWLMPSVWAELYNEKGRQMGRFEGTQLRIYPGTSIRQQIDLTGVPKGQYKALIVIDNGDEHVFGAQYQLAF